MPVYAVEFRTALDEQEPLQRCSIDAAVYISLSALPGFLGGSDSQESACSAGDSDSISGSKRSPGEGNDYLLQYSCLERARERNCGKLWEGACSGSSLSRSVVSDSLRPAHEVLQGRILEWVAMPSSRGFSRSRD